VSGFDPIYNFMVRGGVREGMNGVTPLACSTRLVSFIAFRSLLLQDYTASQFRA
jgi:hypothetical protein